MRCIVTVATEGYVGLQRRLLDSLAGWRGRMLAWTGALPPGSPSHEEEPYAFKLFAFREAAAAGCASVLWLDSPCVAAGSLDPVFDRLEREGHLLVSAGEPLGRWSNDACLRAYGLTRSEAMDVPLMHGSFVGLDLSRPSSRAWLDGMFAALARGLFRGPYFSTHAPAEVVARRPGKPRGPLGPDRRCWGHRHDEAVGSGLALRLGLSLSPRATLSALTLP
jgi:hypothetical protein